MAPLFSEIPADQYFLVDVQSHLPEYEINRRDAIKKELEAQFRLWETKERHLWLAIRESATAPLLGLNWNDWLYVLPVLNDYFNSRTSFGLLSELQLSVIKSHLWDTTAPERWLYKQHSRYQILIQDFGDETKQYRIPLIELAVTPSQNPDKPVSPALFQKSTHAIASRMLPRRTAGLRVISFPQTRYSFIEDEIFHVLYPLPDEQAKLMSHTLLRHFQANDGYYNIFPDPFADSFVQKTHGGRKFRFLAAMYPVIDFEFVVEYEKRKKSERFVTFMQQQPPGKRKDIPLISRWRYSRKFDFAEESTLRAEPFQSDNRPERIQSARALFEYSCGDHDTIKLDRRQVSALVSANHETSNRPHLLVVEPLWLIIFPDADTICVFRNEKDVDHFNDLWEESIDPQNWGQILTKIVDKADRGIGKYESTYRKTLLSLQFKVHSISDRSLIKNLVEDVSEFVAELTILLDPLQEQIEILQSWLEYQRAELLPNSKLVDSTFDDSIKTRKAQYESLRRLLDRGRELQASLFQLSNIETANLQSEIALKMAEETKIQVDLAKRNESQNKAIMVFTVITVVFLPLSFFTSYFGKFIYIPSDIC